MKNESLTIHWRAVFAGAFISALVYFTLVSLGVAIGAGQTQDLINGQSSASMLGTGVGVWLAVSVLISLFVGSYSAGRISGVIATRIGYMQGAVISALFFALMIAQSGSMLKSVTAGVGAAGSALGGTIAQAGQNPAVTDMVEDNFSELKFKSSNADVIRGVLSRVVRGDNESAKNYLAAQSGISSDDADARLKTIKDKITAISQQAGQAAAEAAKQVGWWAFIVMALGSVFAMFGGGVGAQVNIRKPISDMDMRASTINPAFV
jgi:hypothetical protein